MTDDDGTASTSLGLIIPPSKQRNNHHQAATATPFHTPEFRANLDNHVREDEDVDDEDVALRSVVTTEAETRVIEEERAAQAAQEEKRERAELAKMERERIARQRKQEQPEAYEEDEEEDELEASKFGALLEAAFVDPAYAWPPVEGVGKNAIELQASIDLLEGDGVSVGTTESMRERMRPPPRPVIAPSKKWWQCCKKDDAAIDQIRDYEKKKMAAKEARKAYAHLKKEKKKQKELARRMQTKYNRIPEGILIYRLDTSKKRLMLMSPPHTNTDLSTLVVEMTVVSAYPSSDKSRRGIVLVGADGQEATLTACEQRTAVSWLEAINLMTAKAEHTQKGFSALLKPKSKASQWTQQKLPEKEYDAIEERYLNLANYSNKLIRAGALPGGKKGSGGAGGIYYSVERVNNDPFTEEEEEALEAVAKRRAVIKDSWDFYRMICSLLRDRHKYDEVFRRMQLNPVYPYLNSMTGLNDPGDAGYENPEKTVVQPEKPEYVGLSKTAMAKALVSKAEAALPSLVEICKALAGSLGMEEVGVGPVKEASVALRKADKKYEGDLLKVTDYCRALLVVKDFPSLLALLELARDSFGPLIRRVKMSSLKKEQKALPGGYRHCIINIELKQHICEIQVHLWPMWVVCGVGGFRHYRHCVEYSTDSFDNSFDALDGLDRKTMAELIVMAEEAVAETPLDNLDWYHERCILDYFAETGLFMKHGLYVWAEITLRHLIRLRTESPDIGPDHHETIILHKYMAECLEAQGKKDEAEKSLERVQKFEDARNEAARDAEKSMWDYLVDAPNDAYDMLMDPNRKAREAEEKLRQEVKASKKAWRKVRSERFPFLDVEVSGSAGSAQEEKKVDGSEPTTVNM
mmetsp:Transcript_5466/g.11179  ORF Transcript_5466/g.11179 Transcript_5466/m.11179 type:complete len:863 (+) Transcript_5466:27-2615(+)